MKEYVVVCLAAAVNVVVINDNLRLTVIIDTADRGIDINAVGCSGVFDNNNDDDNEGDNKLVVVAVTGTVL
jgi:hypothetical protein